jgi:D-alanine-D-alanine ligase
LAEDVVAELGEDLVVKPNAEGSSVGLALTRGAGELRGALGRIGGDKLPRCAGGWLVEERIFGTELSAGVLNGRALGVVEICPRAGVYDYANKYTAGATEYFAPARIGEEAAEAARQGAEVAFAVCGCRDFARVDFILRAGDKAPFLLEVNTLPGMTGTSLLPKSAGCCGLDFAALTREMALPALRRFGGGR